MGYIGGKRDNPTYEQICTGTTGHVEAIEVTFDFRKVSYEELVKFFFEIHDFTQTNGQGPDLGDQYLSVIFYADESQQKTAEAIFTQLHQMGYKVATTLQPAAPFYAAEEYHQGYYSKTGTSPYCHVHRQIF